MEDQNALKVTLYILEAAVFLLVMMGFFWVMKWKYNRDIDPSKKHPHGKLVAEFWTEAGPRRREVVPIEANGFEVNPKSGAKLPRYFFNKSALGSSGYPSWMPFRFLQVRAPTVSWYENCSDAIDPRKKLCTKWRPEYEVFCDGQVVQHEAMMTAEMHDQIRDTDSLGIAQMVNEEIAQTQKELQKALTMKLDKRIVYALLVVASVAAVGAAVFAYQSYESVKPLTGG